MDLKILGLLATIYILSQINGAASCYCGIPNREKRIIGGMDTEKNEYPWQVGLVNSPTGKVGGSNRKFYQTQPFCGGSIIGSRTILTAAHCVTRAKRLKEQFPASELEVLVGEHDTEKKDGQIRFKVEKVMRHHGYSKEAKEDQDFALLILKSDIKWSKLARPVCLPNSEKSYENKEAIVSGWGRIKNGWRPNTAYSTILQEVEVKTMQNSHCMKPYTIYTQAQISQNMICAAVPQKDSCSGDSGGPLVTKEAGDYYSLVGVVSWGDSCGKLNAPGIYARVNKNLDWIKQNTVGESCPIPPKGKLRCTGQNNGCCTKENPCEEGEGDCDNNHQCKGKLVCGKNNCPKEGENWSYGDDCCFNFEDKPGPDMCKKTNDCGEHHGHCNGNKDCEEGLECGDNNCKWNPKGGGWWSNWNKDDCCYLPPPPRLDPRVKINSGFSLESDI